ncbi:MAG: hypothetical protein LBG93_02950 [Treponema sp.]|jgi:hypothetical protein|nr:hypothetical protein [Treponema sp.]
MKRLLLTFFLFFAGMFIFAQTTDMSHWESQITRLDATFVERLTVLEIVRDQGHTGIGGFYHTALQAILTRLPEVTTNAERFAAQAAVRIAIQGIGSEQYSAAASDLWAAVLAFDVTSPQNDGLIMQDALTALGQVGGSQFTTHVVHRLNSFNVQNLVDTEVRRRVQRAVVGAINALESFGDPAGFPPVFFASIGPYELAIRNMASIALTNIVEDPGFIIAEIIRDPSNPPSVKYQAWQELLRSNAGNESKAHAAAVALDVGWTFGTNIPAQQRDLRSMRVSAMDIIRVLGAADDSVYVNLERSFRNNFVSTAPDYEEIRRTIVSLSSIGSERSVDLLTGFLSELHNRRRSGPWRHKERQLFNWVIAGLGASGTQSQRALFLLSEIEYSQDYTFAEQGWARDALRALASN